MTIDTRSTFENNRLVILDADGTTINAFEAMTRAFDRHDMKLGDIKRFQKRHNLFKYLGGVKEFPKNLKNQIKKIQRDKLIDTLTQIYREEAVLYDGIAKMINNIAEQKNIIFGVVTRNITREPEVTLSRLFERNGIKNK